MSYCVMILCDPTLHQLRRLSTVRSLAFLLTTASALCWAICFLSSLPSILPNEYPISLNAARAYGPPHPSGVRKRSNGSSRHIPCCGSKSLRLPIDESVLETLVAARWISRMASCGHRRPRALRWDYCHAPARIESAYPLQELAVSFQVGLGQMMRTVSGYLHFGQHPLKGLLFERSAKSQQDRNARGRVCFYMNLATQKGIFRLELHTRHDTKLKVFWQRGVNAFVQSDAPFIWQERQDHHGRKARPIQSHLFQYHI